MTCEIYRDIVAAHVDGTLTPTEQHAAEHHLQSCAPCQQLFTDASVFKAAFSASSLIVPVPTVVEQRLRRTLAAKREPTPPWWDRLWGLFPRPRFVLGFATAVILIAVLLPQLFSPSSEPNGFAFAHEQYEAATNGRLALAYQITDPQVLETTFNASGALDFQTHVLDLRPAGYQLKGGQVIHKNGHPVAIALYDGPDGPIVCLRQKGEIPSFPDANPQQQGKYVYTYSGYTVSVVQFPNHFCTLISRASRDTFMQRLAMLPSS